MSLFDDLRNLFQKDKKPSVTKVEPKIAKANPYGDGVLEKKAVTQPTVTNVPTKAESPARTIPKPPQEVPTGLKKNVPAGGTVVRQVGASQPSPPEILAHNDWVVKNAKTYSIRDLIENRYKVEEVFSGAMGYVYIGRDTRQRITFAIKQPKEAILADRDLFSRVLQEADAWTGLGMHPNIAYCYFVRAIEGVPHIFIEYVDGGTLEEWISDRRCTDYKVGLDMAIQFCHGLERAHERGMIHRDIKPRNVLVTKGGQVKVTDFGLVGAVTAVGKSGAKRGGDEHGTRMGDTMGTHAYMSPEQFNDPRHKSAEAPKGVWYESDIYSFGVCMWEMFCGRRPYEVSIEVKDGAPDPRDLKRDISDGLRTLLLRSVEFDRSKRQQNFSELREELNAIFRELYGTDAPHYRLELHDTTADELNNQGYSYYELGREVEARKCFEAAVTANSTHSEAVFNLALLQWRAGEIDDIVVLRRIRSCLNPAIGKEKISELQGYIHAERFDPVSAKELLKLYPTRFEEIFGQSMIGTIGLIRTFEGHSKWVTCLSPSVDGKYALSGSGDNTLKLWEIGTGKCLRTFNGHSDGVRSVSLSGNARYALSGSNDKTLKLWEVETGECLRTFMGHRLQVTSLSQGTNDRYVLSGSNDGTLKLWDVQTGECLRTFEGHSSGVQSVCLSGNGKCALSGSFDHTLKLWDIKTGSCLRTFEGHNDFVQDVTLSADSRYALGSWDNTMKLWNLATGECLRTFEGGGGPC